MVYRVASLDVHSSEVVKEMLAVVPENFVLETAKSYNEEEQIAMVKDADFIMASWAPVPEKLIRAANKVKLIQKWGIGYDKISIETAKELNIPVAITAGSNAIPVAEFTIGLILSVYRKIPFIDKNVRAGKWLKTEMRSQCFMVNGKTIGLIGMGAIARKVAKILKGFDVEVLYYDIVRLNEEEQKSLNVRYVEMDELLSTSDIISIHIPFTKDTKELISTEQFKMMKPSAVIINVSRGGIVSEDALVWALSNKIIAGAAVDVYEKEPPKKDNPLFEFENVVVTSHSGGGVLDNVANVTRHAFDNMIRIIEGRPLDDKDIVVRRADW